MAERFLAAVPKGVGTGPGLYDEAAAVYAFFREHVFRDDTQRIVSSLWPHREPAPGGHVIEVGCGPGLYARRLSARFRQIRVTGIDQSVAQVRLARARAAADGLDTCRFTTGDALRLPFADGSIDGIVASRLLSSVADPAGSIRELRRVLRPGGRCFVAEPRHYWQRALPIAAMVAAASIRAPSVPVDVRRTLRATRTFDGRTFDALVRLPDWRVEAVETDGRYRYATCRQL